MSQEKERLLARKARIESRLAAIQETEEKKREKEDQRRAAVAGQAVLKRARKDQAFAARLHEILDAEIRSQRDRALFDLPPRTDSSGGQTAAPESGQPAGEDTQPSPRPLSGLASSS